MVLSGFSKQKLKTNLKLAINRLKLLEKKKSKFVASSYSTCSENCLFLSLNNIHSCIQEEKLRYILMLCICCLIYIYFHGHVILNISLNLDNFYWESWVIILNLFDFVSALLHSRARSKSQKRNSWLHSKRERWESQNKSKYTGQHAKAVALLMLKLVFLLHGTLWDDWGKSMLHMYHIFSLLYLLFPRSGIAFRLYLYLSHNICYVFIAQYIIAKIADDVMMMMMVSDMYFHIH